MELLVYVDTFLATSHKYVLLGQFSTDPLEKEFGKLCQGSGGTYFINVQQCIEKLQIKQTTLLLNQNVNIDEFDVNPSHQYTFCDYKLCEEGSEIFDNLESLEPSLSNEIKMALVYIAGYITRNDNQPSECETHFYYEKYGKYTNLTDHGKLKVPSNHTCQWLFFCFILFHTIKEKVCYKSLSNIFMLLFEFHFFQYGEKACFYFCKNSFEKFFANMAHPDQKKNQL